MHIMSLWVQSYSDNSLVLHIPQILVVLPLVDIRTECLSPKNIGFWHSEQEKTGKGSPQT